MSQVTNASFAYTIKSPKRKAVLMDNKKFGQFILQLRKEKGWTQLELAEKLNITDKAVSKWERGVGFPDIKMIEPLAEIFNVSVLEIMRSEKVSEQSIPTENASEAINNVIDVVSFQRKIERRNILITIITFSAIVMLLFLIDVMQWEGFIMICLPIIMLGTGLYLIGLSIYRISTINISFFMLRIYIGRSSSCLAKKEVFWLPILF